MRESEEGVEVIGRTIDEAVQKGLEVLELRRDEVNVEVVSDGARTLFGFRPGQVRVRLVPKHKLEASADTATVQEQEMPSPDSPRSLDEEAEIARKVLAEMLRRMGIRARVEARTGDQEEPITLNIKGRRLGLLIGRRGETLAAIQFLTRLMASRQLDRRVNVMVDVDDYRRRREESLRRLAIRMAETAVETGRTQELEPMPAAERRIIHLALRDFDGVTTESVGEGDQRRVTLIPGRKRED